jgi:TolB-like protein
VQAVLRLYREARRRKVFRTGALYVLGAWLMLQVADVLFPAFGVPDAAIQGLVWTAALGFPLALVFGWLYEVGPQGIRRTAPSATGALPEPQPLARRDYLILAAFAAIATVLVVRAVSNVRETPLAASTAAASRPAAGVVRLENSIAVLPFANISDDPANEYFCDGISEEILDRLAGFRELAVIGRTSSFAFKDSDYGIDRISALLGVRYVLQGSVRKAGDRLRISAQLLDQGGRQVWNQAFDRQLENVFEIQSEIAAAVATTVASQVTAQPEKSHRPALEAYEHYLTGRTLLHRRDVSGARQALERAVAIDPEFAEAYAELAIAQALDVTPEDEERARQSVERALELQPRLLRARAAQGFVLMASDPAEGERVLKEVLAQEPNMSDALLWLHLRLAGMPGRGEEAHALLERAALIDPLHPSIAGNLASQLLERGQTAQAQSILDRLLGQPMPGPIAYLAAAGFSGSTGRLTEMSARSRQAALLQPSFVYLLLLLQSCATLGDWEAADAVNDRMLGLPPQGLGRIFRQTALPGFKGETDVALRRVREAFDEQGLTLTDLPPGAKAVAGTHFARGGDYAAAIEALEPVIDLESPYEGGSGLVLFGSPAHALAWAYLNTGAEAKAARLLAAASGECSTARAEGRFRDSEHVHRCAEVELLRGNIESALDGLELAIEAGWRGYYVRERDPYWASAASHPRYRALMAKVKADVDRQRAEVQRVDPGEAFLARLDAAIAATDEDADGASSLNFRDRSSKRREN